MNVRRDICVHIDGNYWNYYTGHVVFEKVEWMMPREYYKDKNEYVYQYGSEWTEGFKERYGHNLRYDSERHIEHDQKMKDVMKDYGEYCVDWRTASYEEETDEPIGVYLDKEPHYSTKKEIQANEDYWYSQECGLD